MSELGGESALPPTVPQWLRGGEAVLGAAGVGAAGDAGGRFRRTRERGTSHAKAFRQWLVRTVGLVRLCHGCGVLDVAGGKGELAFQLLAADREAQLLASALELHLFGGLVRSERQEQDNLLVGLCVGVR